MTDPGISPAVRRRELAVLGTIAATFGVLLVLWAALVPPFQAPDERAHYDAAVHLAAGDGWPAPGALHYFTGTEEAARQAAAGRSGLANVPAGSAEDARVPVADRSTWRELFREHPGEVALVDQMSQHPPTAYALDALVLRAAGFPDLRWDHALLLLRLFDGLLVLPLPVLAWAAVRRVTRSPRAALVGAAALFAVPELASIGASVTNDALTMLLGGGVTVLVARVVTGDGRWRVLVATALALGALTITKGTGLPAVPFVGLAVLAAPGALRSAGRVLRAAAVLVLAGLVSGWWWLHNLVAYGRLQPDGYVSIRPPQSFPAGQGPDPVTFLDVSWRTITRTFWGSPGANAGAAMPAVVVVVLTVVTLGVVLVWAFRRSPERRAVVLLAVFPALLIAGQTYTSVHGYTVTTQVVATQGRYYFPAVVALVVLSAVAWRRLPLTRTGREALPTTVAAVASAVACCGLVTATVGLVVPGGPAAVAVDPLGVTTIVGIAGLALAGMTASTVLVARSGPRRATPAPSTIAEVRA